MFLQMYESDGSIMVYWHALDCPETPTGKCSAYNDILTSWNNYSIHSFFNYVNAAWFLVEKVCM